MRNAAAYAEQLKQLLPVGRAWSREPGSTLARLMLGLGEEFARVDSRAETLLDEADPLTALELLPDWERVAGLPDTCIPVTGTVRERQVAAAQKIAGIGGQSISFLIELVTRLGLDAEIEEFEPFSCDSDVDAELFDDAWRHAFVVRALPPSETSGLLSSVQFTALTCDSTCDERLDSYGLADLECVISRAAPAHTIALFSYPIDPEPILWFDFTT